MSLFMYEINANEYAYNMNAICDCGVIDCGLYRDLEELTTMGMITSALNWTWTSLVDDYKPESEEKFKVDGNAHGAAMKTEELFGVESMDCSTTSGDVKCCGDDLDDSKDLSISITSMVEESDDDNASSMKLTTNSSCNTDDCCGLSTTDDLCGTGSTTTTTAKSSNNSSCTSSANSLDDDMQDLYGSRNYGLPSSRPTMISAKYRQKEERRKVLKLSMNKLKRIEDPESSLRRSVLINNTVKRLQREAKEEKSQKSQITSSLASQNKCFGLTSDFLVKQEENLKNDYLGGSLSSRTSDQLLDITNLPDGKTCSKYGNDCLDCDEAISDLTFPVDRSISKGRKRSIDETLEEECDVLSQFYLPPTPRRISPLDEDEDEDVNVVDIDTPVESLTKKRRGCGDSSDTLSCCLTAADRLRDNLPSSHFDEWSMDESILLQATAQTSQPAPSSSPFSCGHSSMLNEIVVYHNLIASLES